MGLVGLCCSGASIGVPHGNALTVHAAGSRTAAAHILLLLPPTYPPAAATSH